MYLKSPKIRLYRSVKTAAIISFTVFILLGLICIGVSAAPNLNADTLRGNLWNTGGISTMSNSDVLTGNALLKYAKSGVFDIEGFDCSQAVQSMQTATVDQIINNSKCKKASEFYTNASAYAEIVEARMKIADKNGSRLDAAMNRFSDLATTIFSALIGFGLLTSFLVFTVLFMRIAWMPAHVMEKRRMVVDIGTSAASVVLLGNIWVVISLFQSCFSRFWQTYAVYSKDWRTVVNMVLTEYQGFLVGISGIATLFVLAMFIVNFIGLAMNGSNAQKRSEKINSLIMCAIAAAGLGSITIIVGFAWNLLS